MFSGQGHGGASRGHGSGSARTHTVHSPASFHGGLAGRGRGSASGPSCASDVSLVWDPERLAPPWASVSGAKGEEVAFSSL